MQECKFAALCGGGHTTAQHFLSRHEHRIKDACGVEAFDAIEAAVDRAAALERMADRIFSPELRETDPDRGRYGPIAQGGANHTTTTNDFAGRPAGFIGDLTG